MKVIVDFGRTLVRQTKLVCKNYDARLEKELANKDEAVKDHLYLYAAEFGPRRICEDKERRQS